jgi:hypothetical protein
VKWTENTDAVALAERMWCEERAAASEIARQINERWPRYGVSRNAIIGYAHRQCWPLKGKARPTLKGLPRARTARDAIRERLARPPAPEAAPPAPAPVFEAVTVLPPPKKPPVAIVVTGSPVDLIDLQPPHCRYPLGDGPFLFCGDPRVDGLSPYCAAHTDLCYVPSKPKSEKTIWNWATGTKLKRKAA